MTRTHSIAIAFILALATILNLTPRAIAQDCELGWDFDFGDPGIWGVIEALAVFDDGTGPAVYVAGNFTSAGGASAASLAKWDGRSWTEPGGGIHAGDRPGDVYALQVWDDGRGPALYVGGRFTHAGATPANNVARWDGQNWEALGEGTDDFVFSFGTFNDGRGEALYVGGKFEHAGGQPASLIARWNGTNWEPLGSGLKGRFGNTYVYGVMAMAAYDDGNGPALYVGGDFLDINPPDRKTEAPPALYIARWNGRTWSNVPQSNLHSLGVNHHIDDLMVFDNGDGPALYVVGAFDRQINGQTWQGLLKWNGHDWSAPLPDQQLQFTGEGHPFTMTVFDDGSGPALWFGGTTARFLGRRGWNGSTIFSLKGDHYDAPVGYPGGNVNAIISFDDGSGPALYAGGEFGYISMPDWSHITAHGITRWYPPPLTLSHTPLIAGRRAAFTTTCASPGQRVIFACSTTGLGSFHIPQLDVTLDLDKPHLFGQSIANIDGEAKLSKAIPPNASGKTVFFQSAHHRRTSRVTKTPIQ